MLTKVIPIAVSCWLATWAQDSADGLTLQRRSIEAMQESLTRQRQAEPQKPGENRAASFFLLPPPKSMGATTFRATAAEADCQPLPGAEIDSLIGSAAKRESLDADLLRRVMRQESGFKPCAVSSKGALGLMQLMPSTAEQFGVTDAFDARKNVDAGAKFLKQLLGRYEGDIAKALAAYNAGPSRVDAAGGVPQIPETLDYLRGILSVLPIGR